MSKPEKKRDIQKLNYTKKCFRQEDDLNDKCRLLESAYKRVIASHAVCKRFKVNGRENIAAVSMDGDQSTLIEFLFAV